MGFVHYVHWVLLRPPNTRDETRDGILSAKQNAGLRLMTMSTQPISESDKHLELSIEDLLRRARPLPSHDEMVIDDLDDEEGMAFLAALEE